MRLDIPKNKLGQLKSIRHGRGIQHVLDEAYRIFGNPMLIFDMEYNLIAHSGFAANDDPIWNEFMANGGLCAETLEFIRDEGFIDNVANSTIHDGVTYLFSEKLKYNRIFGQLYNRCRLPVADLVAVECETPFEENTPDQIKMICDVLSKELGKSDYYQDYGQTYQESIVKKLIEGSIGDKGIYTGHVANIDRGLKTNVFVAVADIVRRNPGCADLVYFRDLMKRTQPAFKYYIYSNHVAIIISSDDASLRGNKDLDKLSKLFGRENVYAGVSGGFENLFEMQTHYNEAADALRLGLARGGAGRIFLHDDLTGRSPGEL